MREHVKSFGDEERGGRREREKKRQRERESCKERDQGEDMQIAREK